MGSTINGVAGRSAMTQVDKAQDTAPAANTGRQVKSLYGTATTELMNMMNRLSQFSATAQAVVSSRNPDLQ